MGEQRISDAELIAELRRLATDLDKTPTVRAMNERGAYSSETYRVRFGSWNAALDRADLPKNRNIPASELLDGLRELTAELGHVPTQGEMADQGPYAVTTYQDHFGSYSEARAAAGLPAGPVTPHERVSDWELLQDVQRVADALDDPPSRADFNRLSEYDSSTVVKRFGGFHAALRIVGAEVEFPRRRIPELVLLIELRGLTDELGRTPTVEDLNEYGEFSEMPYTRRFGSYAAALQEAGLSQNRRPNGEGVVETECTECGTPLERQRAQVEPTGNVFCSRECYYAFKSRHYSGENHWAWAGHDAGYGPNWEQTREDVLARDNYRCQECGMTDTEHREEYGASLSIHHIEPRSAFDDLEEADVLDNLVALCKPCHLEIESNRRGGN